MQISTEVKVCRKCGIQKSINEFYKRPTSADGRRNECIACHAIRRRKYHNEIYKYKRFSASIRKRDKFKAKAVNVVNHAIRDGKLTRQPCEVCGNLNSQAHHEDYSKPLEITWLCVKHHNEKRRIYNVVTND